MSPLRAATTGATAASVSFSSAIGTPNLPIRVRARANTINRCNSAGGKTQLAARRPHGRSESHSEQLALTQRVRLPPESGRKCDLKFDRGQLSRFTSAYVGADVVCAIIVGVVQSLLTTGARTGLTFTRGFFSRALELLARTN